MRERNRTLNVAAALCAAAVVAGTSSFVSGQGTALPIVVSIDERAARGLAVARVTGQGDVADIPFAVQTTDKGRTLQVRCTSGSYIVRTRSLISAPIDVAPGTCSAIQALMFPRASVKMRLISSGVARPRASELFVHRCDDIAATVFHYPLRPGNSGTSVADIPADCVDLTVVAPHMAPMKMPRLVLTLGQIRDLGIVRLSQGATARVTVRTDSGVPAAGALVSLIKAEDAGTFVGSLLAGTPVRALQKVTDADGNVEFAGAAPGLTYLVATRDGSMGFSGPVELEPAVESPLEGITLLPQASVAITAIGDMEWLPFGTQLDVIATPSIAGRWYPQAFIRTHLEAPGTTSQMALPLVGRWRFELHATAGHSDGLLSQVTSDVATTGTTVSFDMERRPFSGQVSGLGRQTPGALTLAREGTTYPKYETDVSASGEFTVALEGPGTYDVEFTSTDRSVIAARSTGVFTSGVRTVVRLPTGQVSGQVIGPGGAPLSGAIVSAKPADLNEPSQVERAPNTISSSADGTFGFVGLSPGVWEMRASDGSRAAEPQLVTVANDYAVTNVKLVIEDESTLTGYAVDESGQPVPRAAGWAFVETIQPGQVPSVSQFVTDVQGYFRIALDRPVHSSVQVIVIAPGRAAAAYRVTGTPERSPKLVVPSFGGELRVVFPHSDDTPNGLARGWNLNVLINQEGAMLPLVRLLESNAATVIPTPAGTTVLVPVLAPGSWRLVKFPDLGAGMLFLSGTGALPIVGHVEVHVHSKVMLDLRVR